MKKNREKKHNLKVIYDAAHAFGVDVNGRGIGTYGDASMFSFHATKVFNTIEGGAVTFQDPSLEILFNYLKNFGITGKETVEYIGGNAKMNEFQAAMGICNLRHVNDNIEKRRLVAERYREHLAGVPGIRLMNPKEGIRQNYAYFPVAFDGFSLTRNEVYDLLATHHVFARKYFYPLITDFECYRERFSNVHLPVAKKSGRQRTDPALICRTFPGSGRPHLRHYFRCQIGGKERGSPLQGYPYALGNREEGNYEYSIGDCNWVVFSRYRYKKLKKRRFPGSWL